MHINIILSNSIDSLNLVKKLRNEGEEFIVILDYDLIEEINFKNNVLYISPTYANKLVREHRTVRYYKSLYVYPGMYEEID